MPRQPLFVGDPVLIVVDIQSGAGQGYDVVGIDLMPGNDERIANAERLVAAARAHGVPIVFFQEVHRPSGVDFGRELDGAESRHCIEGEPATDLWPTLVPQGDNEFHIRKRRYSCFIGTDLEILLRGLRAQTLVLIGGLTDVCVHYTFADGHQRDYYVRVVEDCVGGSTAARHEASLDAMEYLQAGARRATEEIITAFAELGATRKAAAVTHHLVEAPL
jgi:nicotinamidase-related amidase